MGGQYIQDPVYVNERSNINVGYFIVSEYICNSYIYIRLQLIIFVISFEYSLFLVPGGIASASGKSSVVISQDGEYPCISFVINGSMIAFFNVTTRTQ